ncbi:hypothetical protein DKK76_09870 [Frischella perrara]|uniref:Uncharacterized protein n=1 Tax=Frischella perrara TaxID=1267021 RepID=A0A318N0R3_FRIPE|nr:hypothetical protein [Frischella perrara]PXY94464.1 hypothetical protein DKK76_09870 [Frischella perrara]
MKKLTLKQVALGLLIAGYSISGAYAADTVSTKTDFILGHAPLVNSTIQQSFSKNSVDIKVFDNDRQIADNAEVKNGYTIKLTYKLADQDGDTDPGLETASTVKFAYMKRNTTDYIWVTAGTPTTDAGGEVTVSWTIPAAAIGSKIYYAIIPKTKYGNPNQSTKEVYGNVFKKADAGSRDVTQTGTNIPNDGVDSGNGGGLGPDVPGDGTIKPNENTFAITIYEATINNGAVAMNTALDTSSKPEVGKTYAAKVTLSQGSIQDITTQFKYTWSLVDFDGDKIGDSSLTSQAVDNVQASTVNYQDDVSSSAQAVTNIAYTIPVNDQVKKADGSAVTGLFAGAQGYKLKVEAEAL